MSYVFASYLAQARVPSGQEQSVERIIFFDVDYRVGQTHHKQQKNGYAADKVVYKIESVGNTQLGYFVDVISGEDLCSVSRADSKYGFVSL